MGNALEPFDGAWGEPESEDFDPEEHVERCETCGAEVDGTQLFCPACGEELP